MWILFTGHTDNNQKALIKKSDITSVYVHRYTGGKYTEYVTVVEYLNKSIMVTMKIEDILKLLQEE